MARRVERRAAPKPASPTAEPVVPLSEFEGLIKRALHRTPCEELSRFHGGLPVTFCPHCRGKLVGLADLLAEVRDLFARQATGRIEGIAEGLKHLRPSGGPGDGYAVVDDVTKDP